MSSSDVKPLPQRTETDQSLRVERAQADALIAERTAVVERTADGIVEQEREEADARVETARAHADAALARDAAPEVIAAEAEEVRASEDEHVAEARAEADAQLEEARAAEQQALKQLLAIEREETDERLTTERAHSDQVVASRDDFLAMVSHDTRGILAGLALSSDLLLHGTGDPERTAREAKRIQRFTARMNRLVADLLDVVSMESGKLKVVPRLQDARPLLSETLENFQSLAKARNVALSAQAPGTPIVTPVDHDRMLQVLTNLVGNAMKFTGPGGSVALSLAPHEDGVQFTVRDDGCGISPEHLESIFERFSQVSQSERSGLGLGLYIARGIVEAHRGTIAVTSEPGAGCVFHVTLPAS